MDDKLKSLYLEQPSWYPPVKADDFLVAIGKTKSNSVYHVYSVSEGKTKKPRMKKYNMKVFVSDLITALRREPDQALISFYWYKR